LIAESTRSRATYDLSSEPLKGSTRVKVPVNATQKVVPALPDDKALKNFLLKLQEYSKERLNHSLHDNVDLIYKRDDQGADLNQCMNFFLRFFSLRGEFVQGNSLSDRIRANEPLSDTEISQIIGLMKNDFQTWATR
jgi:hypothetical protein